MAKLAEAKPCIPGIPAFRAWRVGKELMPSSVVMTGIWAFSASSRTSSYALEIITPWPARIRGLSAWGDELRSLTHL